MGGWGRGGAGLGGGVCEEEGSDGEGWYLGVVAIGVGIWLISMVVVSCWWRSGSVDLYLL